jgi:hypothetical protein
MASLPKQDANWIHDNQPARDEFILRALTNQSKLFEFWRLAGSARRPLAIETSSAADELSPAPLGTLLKSSMSAPATLIPRFWSMLATPWT